MRKTILCTIILSVFSTMAFCENTPAQSTPATSPSAEVANDTANTPTPANEQAINCEYKIAPDQNDIPLPLVKKWAQFATVKSFSMHANTLDKELDALKKCYTKQGWEGFYSALQKSGNLNAIKTQNLTVNSEMDGQLSASIAKANQWKVTMPLTVIYQNDKQKLTQLLSVDVLVGRKISGDLGIMQIIATPRVAGESKAAASNKSSQTPSEETQNSQPEKEAMSNKKG